MSRHTACTSPTVSHPMLKSRASSSGSRPSTEEHHASGRERTAAADTREAAGESGIEPPSVDDRTGAGESLLSELLCSCPVCEARRLRPGVLLAGGRGGRLAPGETSGVMLPVNSGIPFVPSLPALVTLPRTVAADGGAAAMTLVEHRPSSSSSTLKDAIARSLLIKLSERPVRPSSWAEAGSAPVIGERARAASACPASLGWERPS